MLAVVPSQAYLSNHAPMWPSLQDLLADAEQYADPAWNAEFYDKIAPHVRSYWPFIDVTILLMRYAMK